MEISKFVPFFSVALDCTFKDFYYAFFRSSWDNIGLSRKELEGKVCAHFKPTRSTCSVRCYEYPELSFIPCLSVRTGWDLYLRAKKFPKGCEILVTAVTIPSMIRIIREHGLIPIPVDIELDTLAPKVKALEKVLREQKRVVAFLFAHLFGRRTEVDSLVNLCHEQGIEFVEDCAESFLGLDDVGHPESDVVLFSFGVIKHVTCFGGAMIRVKERGLFDDMCQIYCSDPAQSNDQFLVKVVKYFLIYFLLNCPNFTKFAALPLVRIMRMRDYQNAVVESLRSFKDDLLPSIRFQPSRALLSVMSYRLDCSDSVTQSLNSSRNVGIFAEKRLPLNVFVPGCAVPPNQSTYWLFPVLLPVPADVVVQRLKDFGIDAFRGVSWDRPELGPRIEGRRCGAQNLLDA